MDIDDKFKFGQYKGLTLKEVYQGTENINLNLLSDYLSQCLLDITVPKMPEFEVCDININEGKINIIPQIANEELEESPKNIIYLGDISKNLEIYFNHFFNKNWYGIVNTLEKYNSLNYKEVIGGDPEYIRWCLSKIENFNIAETTKSNLENLVVYRLLGIKIKMITLNEYCFFPIINKELFLFNKENKVKTAEIKQSYDKINQSKQDFINWDFIIKYKIFFNQLFSTYYNFSEKELIMFKEKLSLGSPYLVLDSGEICMTEFGLIFNNEILWTDLLRKLYLEDFYVRYAASRDKYSMEKKIEDFPLSLSKEFEDFKLKVLSDILNENWDTNDTPEEEVNNNKLTNDLGAYTEDEYTEYEMINKHFNSMLSKRYFKDYEILGIVERHDIIYIFNKNYCLQLLGKISSDISDFSMDNFYLEF